MNGKKDKAADAFTPLDLPNVVFGRDSAQIILKDETREVILDGSPYMLPMYNYFGDQSSIHFYKGVDELTIDVWKDKHTTSDPYVFVMNHPNLDGPHWIKKVFQKTLSRVMRQLLPLTTPT